MDTPLVPEPSPECPGAACEGGAAPSSVSRMGFLGLAGGAAAAAALGGLSHPATVDAAAPRGRAALGAAVGGQERAGRAYEIRVACATDQRTRIATIETNGDEEAYASRIGNFTKLLPHNARGEVDPAAYQAMLAALLSARPEAFETIPMGGPVKFADPQGAYTYALQGTDSAALTVPPPPAFSSAEEAAEMAELYWQALARDVTFANYPTDPVIAAAASDLSRLSAFKGPKTNGAVNGTTVFRSGLAGEFGGPYLSQFLWLPVPYGAMTVPQLYTIAPRKDFMTTFEAWLTVQRGRYMPLKPLAGAAPPPTRYISTGRDLATFLHADFIYQAYLNAGLILYKIGALNPGNPYIHSKNQAGVGTFGPHHLYDLIARVANAAVRVSWYHKWLVHRRVRPESFGGRVHLNKTIGAQYPVHADLLTTSTVLDAVSRQYGSYLLPIAYPEGAPNHPSYPAAHPAITGACVTILKAWFDETATIPNPMIASVDGRSLVPYSGPPLTIGAELNKLAGNLAVGRAFGGVHWRSDNTVGLLLGEAVALGILADERRTYNERFPGFTFTSFDGRAITV